MNEFQEPVFLYLQIVRMCLTHSSSIKWFICIKSALLNGISIWWWLKHCPSFFPCSGFKFSEYPFHQHLWKDNSGCILENNSLSASNSVDYFGAKAVFFTLKANNSLSKFTRFFCHFTTLSFSIKSRSVFHFDLQDIWISCVP